MIFDYLTFSFIVAIFSLVEESHQVLEHEEFVTVNIVRGGYVGHEAFVSKYTALNQLLLKTEMERLN